MALLTANSRVIVQGITCREGGFHAERMKEMGTDLVGGVTPGRGGSEVLGVPVFDTVAEAVRATGPMRRGSSLPRPSQQTQSWKRLKPASASPSASLKGSRSRT